ncbi:MAG: LytTR family DNA-binding domain-containing protein [Alistipes sp.]|jgi:DNA-binding LytR/AlgR family response regulator|nr:LytTR family DNA-binding domain-containing protein [Alistipes sp.]
MTMEYMIVEDEFLSFERLRGMVSELRPGWRLTYRAESVEESVAWLGDHTPGLVFMDIELADQNCFEIFSRTGIDSPVIFTTAYNEYAIRAFKFNSVDYLLKPLDRRDLAAALDKFDRLSSQSVPDYAALSRLISGPQTKERIIVGRGDSFICVETADAALFVSEEKYTSLVTFAGQSYIIDDSLNQLEGQLDRRQFFRASRGHIVNIKAIREVRKHFNGRLKLLLNTGGGAVGVSGLQGAAGSAGSDIIISAARREEFFRWLGGEVGR